MLKEYIINVLDKFYTEDEEFRQLWKAIENEVKMQPEKKNHKTKYLSLFYIQNYFKTISISSNVVVSRKNKISSS